MTNYRNVYTQWLVLFVVVLILYQVNGIMLAETENLARLFVFGNELEQASRFYELTTKFNTTQYFSDIHTCHTLQCIKHVNSIHGENSRIWQFEDESTPSTSKQSCQYKIENIRITQASEKANVIGFNIIQHNCRSDASFKGGSSFEIFAQNGYILGNCGVLDNFDNTYNVKCILPELLRANQWFALSTVPRPVESPCVSMTIILMYEHYDAYSDLVSNDNIDLLSPLRTVLVNNEPFCDKITGLLPSLDTSPPAVAVDTRFLSFPPIPSTVQWYSGLWSLRKFKNPVIPTELLKQGALLLRRGTTAENNFYYENLPHHANNAYLYDTYRTTMIDTTSETSTTDTSSSTTIIADISKEQPYVIADNYAFRSLILTNNGKKPILPYNFMGNNTYSHCFELGFNENVCNTMRKDPSEVSWDSAHVMGVAMRGHGRTQYWEDSEFVRNITVGIMADSVGISNHNNTSSGSGSSGSRIDTDYHFIGPSHLQSIYDSVTEYYYGSSSTTTNTTTTTTTKHNHTVEQEIYNLKYTHSVTSPQLATHIHRKCAELQREYNNNNANNDHNSIQKQHILVLQAGEDLSVTSLRRLLYDPSTSKRLLKTIQNIYNKNLLCGNLKHIIWITAMPYPVCWKNQTNCDSNKQVYRRNQAISVGNIVYLKHLFHIIEHSTSQNSENSISLSVVDAYSIVHSRLIFAENSEIVCGDKFICRIDAVQHREYAEEGGSVLVQTPAGSAVVKAVLDALSISTITTSSSEA